jgi:hypothetical protein
VHPFFIPFFLILLRYLKKQDQVVFGEKKPSESPLQELSNEWSCQYVSTILNALGKFCVPPLVTEVTISS